MSPRVGKKVRVKALEDDLVGDFKKLLAVQIGTSYEKIVLKKGNTTLKDHISLGDYEVHNGTNLELYYS
ncbi:CYFA0S02e07866g1_1 [Cyberlindnera fabianii]|uniref:Ubiquitin-like modifier HUB1 n=1 Tax=Cyberlindnera fabianii TaxID=36022 RepID=A0A061AP09_CYBFA|nr:CYFA0S02e07866g1_1 [Cyberlindnera fabianii]